MSASYKPTGLISRLLLFCLTVFGAASILSMIYYKPLFSGWTYSTSLKDKQLFLTTVVSYISDTYFYFFGVFGFVVALLFTLIHFMFLLQRTRTGFSWIAWGAFIMGMAVFFFGLGILYTVIFGADQVYKTIFPAGGILAEMVNYLTHNVIILAIMGLALVALGAFTSYYSQLTITIKEYFSYLRGEDLSALELERFDRNVVNSQILAEAIAQQRERLERGEEDNLKVYFLPGHQTSRLLKITERELHHLEDLVAGYTNAGELSPSQYQTKLILERMLEHKQADYASLYRSIASQSLWFAFWDKIKKLAGKKKITRHIHNPISLTNVTVTKEQADVFGGEAVAVAGMSGVVSDYLSDEADLSMQDDLARLDQMDLGSMIDLNLDTDPQPTTSAQPVVSTTPASQTEVAQPAFSYKATTATDNLELVQSTPAPSAAPTPEVAPIVSVAEPAIPEVELDPLVAQQISLDEISFDDLGAFEQNDLGNLSFAEPSFKGPSVATPKPAPQKGRSKPSDKAEKSVLGGLFGSSKAKAKPAAPVSAEELEQATGYAVSTPYATPAVAQPAPTEPEVLTAEQIQAHEEIQEMFANPFMANMNKQAQAMVEEAHAINKSEASSPRTMPTPAVAESSACPVVATESTTPAPAVVMPEVVTPMAQPSMTTEFDLGDASVIMEDFDLGSSVQASDFDLGSESAIAIPANEEAAIEVQVTTPNTTPTSVASSVSVSQAALAETEIVETVESQDEVADEFDVAAIAAEFNTTLKEARIREQEELLAEREIIYEDPTLKPAPKATDKDVLMSRVFASGNTSSSSRAKRIDYQADLTRASNAQSVFGSEEVSEIAQRREQYQAVLEQQQQAEQQAQLEAERAEERRRAEQVAQEAALRARREELLRAQQDAERQAQLTQARLLEQEQQRIAMEESIAKAQAEAELRAQQLRQQELQQRELELQEQQARAQAVLLAQQQRLAQEQAAKLEAQRQQQLLVQQQEQRAAQEQAAQLEAQRQQLLAQQAQEQIQQQALLMAQQQVVQATAMASEQMASPITSLKPNPTPSRQITGLGTLGVGAVRKGRQVAPAQPQEAQAENSPNTGDLISQVFNRNNENN